MEDYLQDEEFTKFVGLTLLISLPEKSIEALYKKFKEQK